MGGEIASLKDKQALLDSIPGLGVRTIAILLAFYADFERFGNARQAAAFAGLDPHHHESGTSVKMKPRDVKGSCLPAQIPLHGCYGCSVQNRLGYTLSRTLGSCG